MSWWSFHASSFKALKKVDTNCFALGLQLSMLKVGSWKQNNLFWHFSKLSNLELKSCKRGQSKLSCLHWDSTQPRKLQNYKTLQKLKTNNLKTKNLKEKKWKHEIGKAWKLTSSCCVVYVSPTSYKNKNIRSIYVKMSSKILRFPTHLFKKTMLGSAISSTTPSSLHTKYIFSLIHITWPNIHNSDPLILF
jgi:hypothetical protein